MPTVFKREGYRFYFFSNEGDPREPPHVHVRRGSDEAKFWLQPEVAVAESFGFNAPELNALLRMVSQERARIKEFGMDTSATAVRFDDNSMWVELSDGRTLGVPYAWFPRLLNATSKQREAVEIGRFGLHWEDIDEDISIAGLLAGRRDQTVKPPPAAPVKGRKRA